VHGPYPPMGPEDPQRAPMSQHYTKNGPTPPIHSWPGSPAHMLVVHPFGYAAGTEMLLCIVVLHATYWGRVSKSVADINIFQIIKRNFVWGLNTHNTLPFPIPSNL
jgi:hypothetical protein